MDIILYTPGAAGNMVSAVIDSNGYRLNSVHYTTPIPRIKLSNKRIINSMTDIERDEYINTESKNYLSMPSHCVDYHINRKHDYIFVGPLDDISVDWTINRFSSIYTSTNDLQSMRDSIKDLASKSINHTDKIISVRDLLNGKLLDRLSQYINTPLNEFVYNEWLKVTLSKFPIS